MPRRTFRHRALLLVPFLLMGLTVGCESDSAITGLTGDSMVTLTLEGLKPLGDGMNYQAWLVTQVDNNLIGEPVVLFNVDDQGRMIHATEDSTLLAGPFPSNVPASGVLGVAISLERATELQTYSSASFVLSGEMTGGSATLRASDWLALNRDFSGIGGTFSLSTPTDTIADNELSGVWLVDPDSVPQSSSVTLPDSPSGWIYEGWVEVGDHTLSMGKFTHVGFPDSTATYSGIEDPPLFPGEDFLLNLPTGLTPPVDLASALVFITAEPWDGFDDSPEEPFFLRLLEGQVPADPITLTRYDLTNVTSQFPTGTATVQDVS